MSETANTSAPLDLEAVRIKLAGKQGPAFWRSLEEVAETEAFQQRLKQEFPTEAEVWSDPVGRRRFLHLMGASLALAGVTGCTRQPSELIMPYAANPPEEVPGRARYFATALNFEGYGLPVLVESHQNRPTKIEGNPDHPLSEGATNLFTQAMLLEMYDPDRLQTPFSRGRIASWHSFRPELAREMALARGRRGAGLRVLSSSFTSPTLGRLAAQLLEEYPEARWHVDDPLGRQAARDAGQAVFGGPTELLYRLDRAKVVVTLDSDFMTRPPGDVRMIRDFARGRRVDEGQGVEAMNRFYAVEVAPTVTGSNADHRLRLKPSQIRAFAAVLAARLGVGGQAASTELAERAQAWIEPLAADLERNRGAAVVIPGDFQPAEVHELAHAMNQRLGAFGQTVETVEPLGAAPAAAGSLAELVEELNGGAVETLLLLDVNPLYTAPPELELAQALEKARLRVSLSLAPHETAQLCHWQLPLSHDLESWGDTRALDGSVIFQQALIEPIYESRSAIELLALLLTGEETSGRDLVRATWRERLGLDETAFEATWRRALHDGVLADSRPEPQQISAWTPSGTGGAEAPASGDLELAIRPDPTIWDGRFSNNGWMQEQPKPISRVTWENVVSVSPATAQRLNLRNEEFVTLAVGERRVVGPVWISPGHADDCVTVTLGYGRSRAGRVGGGIGFNAYLLRTAEAPWNVPAVELARIGQSGRVACVQDHASMEGRDLVRIAPAQEYAENPNIFQHEHHAGPAEPAEEHATAEPSEEHGGSGAAPFVGRAGEDAEHGPRADNRFREGRSPGMAYGTAENPLSLFPEWNYTGRAWGMAIDLNACVGCNACMTACQSENNIPVVGKEQVLFGREMHWIRIDRYFEGELDEPNVVNQPMTCMHCENAPCEPVCPVGATVHSSEGLNDMVYNRCVGTRYCSNNCPYKVRRFNFLLYQDFHTESLKLMRNPDVTVRSRGVMEKCTYCVQRINLARIDADREGRPIRDGEVQTACQQVCPAEAIHFGDINDPESRIAALKRSNRNYGLLTELNTQPRTTYLARLRNPNPEMPGAAEAHATEA